MSNPNLIMVWARSFTETELDFGVVVADNILRATRPCSDLAHIHLGRFRCNWTTLIKAFTLGSKNSRPSGQIWPLITVHLYFHKSNFDWWNFFQKILTDIGPWFGTHFYILVWFCNWFNPLHDKTVCWPPSADLHSFTLKRYLYCIF